jgi:hypothetical protein
MTGAYGWPVAPSAARASAGSTPPGRLDPRDAQCRVLQTVWVATVAVLFVCR